MARQDSCRRGWSRREVKLTEVGGGQEEKEPSNLERGLLAKEAGGWAQSVDSEVGLVAM